MKNKTLETLILVLSSTPIIIMGQYIPISKNTLNNSIVNVRVVDENNNPVENVHVKLYSNADSEAKPGLTDTNGMYSTFMKNIYAEIDGTFKKEGYYKSMGNFWGWDKWGGVPPADKVFTIMMKQIIDPVQLKYREIDLPFPRLEEPVGFDFEVGDWVFPDGKGKIADMFLTGQWSTNDNVYAYNMDAEFSGELNGIKSFYYPHSSQPSIPLRSELPPPTIAPETGYEKTFNRWTRRIPTDKWSAKSSLDEDKRWIFRIRTEVDDDGNIVSANYGWTTKDIFSGNIVGTCRLKISYYYNLDPKSRSLEPKNIANIF